MLPGADYCIPLTIFSCFRSPVVLAMLLLEQNFRMKDFLCRRGFPLILLVSLLYARTAMGTGGTVVAWGDNTYGQTSVSGFTNVVAIAGAFDHAWTLRADGTVIGWGTDSWIYSPHSNSNIIAIASSGYSVNGDVFLKSDGTVDCSASQVSFNNVSNAVSVTANGGQRMVLKSDGTVTTDFLGGAFHGNFSGISNIVGMAIGTNFSLVLRSDGTVVGPATTVNGSQPAPPSDWTNIVAITGGVRFAVALRADSTVAVWQAGPWGLNPIYSQTNVPPGLSNVVAVSAQGYQVLALKTDGTVVAWGDNSYNQTNVPSNATNVMAISAGGDFGMALMGDGPPVLQVPLANPTWDSNGFSASLPTQSGRVYALEYKNSLSNPDWTALPLVAGNGGIKVLTDPTATNSQRFYRVRRW